MVSREGKVGLTIYVAPELRADLKRLSIDKGMSVEAIVTEQLEKLVTKQQKGKR